MIKSNLKSKQSSISMKKSYTSRISSLQNNNTRLKQSQQLIQQRLNDKLLNIQINLNDKLNFLRKTKIFYLEKLNQLQDKLTVLCPSISQQKQQNQKFNQEAFDYQIQNQNYLKSILNQSHILSQQLNYFTQKQKNKNRREYNAQNIVQQIIFLKNANSNLEKQIQSNIYQQSLQSLVFQGDFNYFQKKITHLEKQIAKHQENLKRQKNNTNKITLIERYMNLKAAQKSLSYQNKSKQYQISFQAQAQVQQIEKIVNDYQSFLKQEQLNKQKLFQQIYQKKLQFQATKKQNLVIKAILSKILNNPLNF